MAGFLPGQSLELRGQALQGCLACVAVRIQRLTQRLIHFGKISQVAEAVKGRHPRIGACTDLGHFWRAGEDPVKALEILGDRVLAVHLKDQVSETEQAVVGEGKMDILAILKTLKKINYKGPLTLEYEANPENPLPGMAASLENIRKLYAKMR